MILRTALLVALALLGVSSVPAETRLPGPARGDGLAPLTAEELFRPATLGQAELSPDGQHLGAIISDEHDARHLLIVNLKDRKLSGLRARDEFDMSTFRWLGEDRVLFNITKDKLYSWGLFTAKLGSFEQSYAINIYDVTSIIGIPRKRPGRVLAWIVQSAKDEGRPGELIEYDALRAPHPTKPDLRDAIVRTYRPPPTGTVLDWKANREGDLALCITWENSRMQLHRYLRDQDLWKKTKLVLEKSTPMSLDPDDRFLWVVTHSEINGYELRRYDLESDLPAEPVLTDPAYDIGGGFLYFSKNGDLVGVTYMQRKPVTVWFSQSFASIQAVVDKSYPDSQNVLVDSDREEGKFIFSRTGPRQPEAYVLLDVEAKKLGELASAAPWLKDRPLQPVDPIGFQTRDGVKLEGYLTLPPDADERHPVPLVVLAHGGPWHRDTAAFDPEVQFLASRGYAVLQPNYRGSTGYAPAISRDHEFDFRRMHDDVTDATRAMLASPFIDSKRVAIMGSSFGGYLALTGVTCEDGLYQCAVSTCGVFDWERMIKSKRSGGRPGEYEFLLDKIGRPGRDRERLEEISPLAHVDRIRVPVLIAHGTDDHIVDIGQSRKLVSALKKRGVPHETFFRSLEGHGFYNYKNRVEYYHRVEAFLAAHLGGASLAPVKASRRQR